eukprot:Gb_11758 [translate_table: standard]
MDSQYSTATSGDVNCNVKEERQPISSSQQPTVAPNPQPMEGLQSAGPPPFLTKTYDMVEDPITNAIVSWSSTNNSFIVWNSHQFSMDLLPRYFKHNNFSSFVRQLNTYGFRKVDPDRWEFANEGFLRGQKHLLKNIHRRKPPSQGQQQQGIGACVEVGQFGIDGEIERLRRDKNVLMLEVVKLRHQQQSTKTQLQVMGQRLQATEQRQQLMMTFLARAMQNPTFLAQLVRRNETTKRLANTKKRRRLHKGEEQPPIKAEERQSSSDSQIVKYHPNPPDASQLENSNHLEALLSTMGDGGTGGQGNESYTNSTLTSALDIKPSGHHAHKVESLTSSTGLDQLYVFEGDSAFENPISLGLPLEDTSAPKSQGEDLDFETVNDVFWEELLNEEFSSQEDSETEVDANFPDHDKGGDSSPADYEWEKGNDVNVLADQIGQMGHHLHKH